MATTSDVDSAFARWLPAKPEAPEAVLAASGERTTSAALSIEAHDVCPYCKAQMQPCKAVGLDVYMCDNDRFVSPAPTVDTSA